LTQWVHKLQLQLRYNAKADYVLALKANHPTLYGQVKDWFEQAIAQGFEGVNFSYESGGHHRTEKRQVWCVPVSQLPPLYHQDDLTCCHGGAATKPMEQNYPCSILFDKFGK